MTENVYWVVKGTIADGKLDAVKELAKHFCALTTTEPGALAYEWSVGDGSQIHIFERYADADAAMAHLGNVGPDLPKLFEHVAVSGIDCYGKTSDTLREAFAAFPVTYHEQFAGFTK